MSETFTEAKVCRSCKGRVHPVLSLGDQFVSNFVSAENVRTGPRCPIALDQCEECTLVQARFTPPPSLLYQEHYWYRSGVNKTMRTALRDVAESCYRLVDLKTGDIVLDIGANDGTLLSNFDPFGIGLVKVAVEPAKNLHDECRRNCTELIEGFWSADDYFQLIDNIDFEPLWDRRAKVVTAIGMFYDLDDPNPFVADVKKVLHPDGVFVCQFMTLRNMLDLGDVGNLAHEHLEYYSAKSLNALFERHGLRIVGAETNSVNGASDRFYAVHAERNWRALDRFATKDINGKSLLGRWVEIVSQEEGRNLDDGFTYERWMNRAVKERNKCVEFLCRVRDEGKRVWGYGASTKGNVILQWYGIGADLIEAIADRQPSKYGTYTAGSGIPVRSEEEFRAARPDYALALPYAFRDEFLARETEFRANGGKFLFPLPKFEVV